MEPPLPDTEIGSPLEEIPSLPGTPVGAGPRRRRGAQDDLAEPPPPERILEALLFAGGGVITLEKAAEVLPGLDEEHFLRSIDALNAAYRSQGRPYTLLAQDQGYVMALRPAFRPLLEQLRGPVREASLSAAAIDVLSLVAYRQPVSKAEIDCMRGAESSAPLRQLVRRALISARRAENAGNEAVYATTARFLDLFHLHSLEDLPQTQDLEKL